MTVPETVGVYVAIPLVVVVLLTIAVFGRSLVQAPNRYRPGRPWNHDPVWYLPHTIEAAQPTSDHHHALGQAARRALDRGADPTGPRTTPGKTAAVGGAVGEW
jgi:hypothetical protein